MLRALHRHSLQSYSAQSSLADSSSSDATYGSAEYYEDAEDEEEEEDDDEEDEFMDDDEAIASEAEALLDSADFDSQEASLLRSALSHFGQVQLVSGGSVPVLKVTLKARTKDGEESEDGVDAALREAGDAQLSALRQKQREFSLRDEVEVDEEDDGADAEEEELERDLAELHLLADAEAKADDATLLALHPFSPSDLTALHSQHERLHAALRAPDVDAMEVMQVVAWFLHAPPACPRYLRLTNEDFHRIALHCMGSSQWMSEDAAGEEKTADETTVDEDEEDDDGWQGEEEECEARAMSPYVTQVFAAMRSSGYEPRRSLLTRALRQAARREFETERAVVLLRETALGRLPAVDPAVRSARLASLDAAIRGEHVDWDVSAMAATKGGRGKAMKGHPVLVEAELARGDSLEAQLLRDGPLLEFAIEAGADRHYTGAVCRTYPEAAFSAFFERPRAPFSAHSMPLTPSSSPTSLPHMSIDLFALMLLHSIPFTRRATVNALHYVCNELQLPSVAALVLLKAHRDGLPLTSSLIDNLVTIAVNSQHLHGALEALSVARAQGVEVAMDSWVMLFNHCVYAEADAVDVDVVKRWAEGRGLRLMGWEQQRGGGRAALMYVLLEEAQRASVSAEELVREAELVISREFVRSMKEGLRDIGQWIRRREQNDEDEDEYDEDDDDDAGDDDHH